MSLSKKINLRERERIIQIERRYGLTDWWKYGLGLIFLALVSFFMFQLFWQGWWGYVVYTLGVLLGLYIIFRVWFFNHFNLFVLTSERVIDIHQVGWFDQIMSSISHQDIKDISVRKKGLLANVFNYGSVIVRSQSDQFFLDIIKIHHPQELQTELIEVGEQYRQNRQLLNTKTIYRNFIKIIPDLNDEQLKTVNQLIMNQFEEVEAESAMAEKLVEELVADEGDGNQG